MKTCMESNKVVAIIFLSVSLAAFAAVEPLFPTGCETVTLLPEAQRRIMAIETYDGRLAALRKDKENG